MRRLSLFLVGVVFFGLSVCQKTPNLSPPSAPGNPVPAQTINIPMAPGAPD